MLRNVIWMLLLWPLSAMAEPPGKLRVEGDRMIYDTFQAELDEEKEIIATDLTQFRALLKDNPEVTTLQLNSAGGIVWVGEEMARIVIDYELTTVVEGECSSTCVVLFLAGQGRHMSRGSKIGFHQTSWSAGAIEAYFDRSKEDHGWQTPFDFASWMYRDTQSEIYGNLSYLIDRGVTPAFAIETLRGGDDIWFPSRGQLTQGGVLRE